MYLYLGLHQVKCICYKFVYSLFQQLQSCALFFLVLARTRLCTNLEVLVEKFRQYYRATEEDSQHLSLVLANRFWPFHSPFLREFEKFANRF